MTLGLKRSMPCIDLSSMSSGGGSGFSDALTLLHQDDECSSETSAFPSFLTNKEEAENIFSSCNSKSSSNKRQKRSEHMNPATAALEEALKQLLQEKDDNIRVVSPALQKQQPKCSRTSNKAISASSSSFSLYEQLSSSKSAPSFDCWSNSMIHEERSKMLGPFHFTCTNEVAAATENVTWSLARMTT